MSRLIDADELTEAIKNELWDWETVDGITATTVLKQTITDIGNQPTVDAEPVKHAHWELRIVPPVFVCSWCREESDVKYNYCPHCGARMDGQYESD